MASAAQITNDIARTSAGTLDEVFMYITAFLERPDNWQLPCQE
jgi:hypothetical protein